MVTKRRLLAIILFIPAMISGTIGLFGCYISYPLFLLFNPKYKLPDDKAGIDIAPITKHFWLWYMRYGLEYFYPAEYRYERNRGQMRKV